MFGFLKKKLKDAVNKFSKKVEEEGIEETVEQEVEEKVEETKEKKVKKIKKVEKKEKKEPKEKIKEEVFEEEISEEVVEEVEEKIEAPKEVEEKPQKKGFFKRFKEKVTTKRISENKFDEIFWDLEMDLLENNVAVEVIDKIKEDLKEKLVDKPLPKQDISKMILDSLKESINGLFLVEGFDLVKKVKEKKPFVIVFVGINGSGKTTSIAKVAHLLKKNKLSVVLAAADTFRSAAIEQLNTWAEKLKVSLIKHNYGSDPAAVAFDAIKHAEAKKIDVVLIDTAGRLHSNVDLMDELSKVIRVAKPDLKIFVGESITGNDCCDQIRKFNEAVGIDGVILTKADTDEKGGTMVSASYISGKPILYLGMGQGLDDLEKFDPKKVMDSLGL